MTDVTDAPLFDGPDALLASALLPEIQAQCASIEGLLTIGNRITPEVLATQRPGGDENPDAGPLGWLAYFKWLHRTHATLDLAASAGGGAGAVELDEALAQSLAEEPHPVPCADGVTRYVYPKGYHALRFLESLGGSLKAVAAEQQLATALDVLEDARVVALAPLVESWALRTWVWILASEGAELPFRDDEEPVPPEWTARLTPEDLLRFGEAHLIVHRQRLAILSAGSPSPERPSGETLSLQNFVAVMGMELGRASRDVMRRCSLGALFAQAVAKARSERAARAAAGSGGSDT